MSDFAAFSVRPLDPADQPEACQLAAAAGVHGIYVLNSLMQGEDDDYLAIHGAEAMLGLLYFGHRGNLIIIGCEDFDPQRIAKAIERSARIWRIALGPDSLVAALAEIETKPSLVDRTQLYYLLDSGGVVDDRLHAGMRLADRKDLRHLFDAAIDLNSSDLNVEGWRVNKSWLKNSIKSRMKRQHTYVIGRPGSPLCKVDVGSMGPGGVMLEGVYTWPHARGRGLAGAIVATVADGLLGEYPRVGLHVDSENMPARRAYESAGMALAGSCRLLLRD